MSNTLDAIGEDSYLQPLFKERSCQMCIATCSRGRVISCIQFSLQCDNLYEWGRFPVVLYVVSILQLDCSLLLTGICLPPLYPQVPTLRKQET